jgi:hypothetical protein
MALILVYKSIVYVVASKSLLYVVTLPKFVQSTTSGLARILKTSEVAYLTAAGVVSLAAVTVVSKYFTELVIRILYLSASALRF